ncbi:N-acetyltransferase [Pararhizobium sp. IMCC21322]|uniref:GNAT family N-acetyltransferase n=1 Tax=Pararhizobium sp. IMCC21322 TaxID=3067903 RepID=UPI002741E70C|nr:GNAT family N-acetyltransferase [Pararhizobium sp. IMCC21322]
MFGTIKRTHFMETKNQFNARGICAKHRLVEVIPNPKGIINRVSRIPWNWINKELYDSDVLTARIKKQNMRLFDFVEAGKQIGYCIAVPPDQNITRTFLAAVGPKNPIEIENIALFPEHAGNGRGRSVINLMMGKLFEDGHDVVCLNTSETNYPTLSAFYERIGMTNVGQDDIPDFNIRTRQPACIVA